MGGIVRDREKKKRNNGQKRDKKTNPKNPNLPWFFEVRSFPRLSRAVGSEPCKANKQLPDTYWRLVAWTEETVDYHKNCCYHYHPTKVEAWQCERANAYAARLFDKQLEPEPWYKKKKYTVQADCPFRNRTAYVYKDWVEELKTRYSHLMEEEEIYALATEFARSGVGIRRKNQITDEIRNRSEKKTRQYPRSIVF